MILCRTLHRWCTHSDLSPCLQRAFSPAWVHANFQLGKEKKQEFLRQHSVWKVEAGREYPACAPAPEAFSALA